MGEVLRRATVGLLVSARELLGLVDDGADLADPEVCEAFDALRAYVERVESVGGSLRLVTLYPAASFRSLSQGSDEPDTMELHQDR